MTYPPKMKGRVAELFPSSFKEGSVTQFQFRQAMQAAGHRVESASAREDMARHIDFWTWINGKRYGIDVKRMKRMSRAWEQQNEYTCLELHGAHPRNKGWLFGGHADLIAFEQEHSFLLVWRERLIDLVEFRVSRERVAWSALAVYKVYSRRDNEEITWVETGLLRHPWVLFYEIEKA